MDSPFRTFLLAFTLLAVAFFLGGGLLSQESSGREVQSEAFTPPEPEDRLKACLSEYEAMEGARPPGDGALLFVGSSSVRAWGTMNEDIPDHRVLNRGCGGVMLSALSREIERLVRRYRPAAVAVYVGDNDIDAGMSANGVSRKARAFYDSVQKAAPSTDVFLLSVKPSLARFAIRDEIERANAAIRELASSREHLHFVDVASPLLNGNRLPRSEYFTEDGLHLTREAYRIWGARIHAALASRDVAKRAAGPRS